VIERLAILGLTPNQASTWLLEQYKKDVPAKVVKAAFELIKSDWIRKPTILPVWQSIRAAATEAQEYGDSLNIGENVNTNKHVTKITKFASNWGKWVDKHCVKTPKKGTPYCLCQDATVEAVNVTNCSLLAWSNKLAESVLD